jgi:hypothetical protein
MSIVGREMVFDRLSRKQTAASIGQQVKLGSANRPKSTRSLTPVLPKRSTSERNGMTMDMRISMLDELEITEQTWQDDVKEERKLEDPLTVNAHLDDLLDKSLSLSSAYLVARHPTVTKIPTRLVRNNQLSTLSSSLSTANARDKVASELNNPGHVHSQTVFERLYQHGTKASLGQQVESVRQKTMFKRKTNNYLDPKSLTVSKLIKSAERVSSAETVQTQTTCPSTADGVDSTDMKRGKVSTLLSNLRPHDEPMHSSSTTTDFKSRCQTLEGTPHMIYTAFSDDSLASTVSSLVGVESFTPSTMSLPNDDSATDPPRIDPTLDMFVLSKWSSTCHGPWKMAIKRKIEKGMERPATSIEPLYIRSMSNVLYDFANQTVSEVEVAAELITALFHRDFDYGRFWTEEIAQVTTVQGGEYIVQKTAESSSICGGSNNRAVSSAQVKFDYTKRTITVVDYYHTNSLVP